LWQLSVFSEEMFVHFKRHKEKYPSSLTLNTGSEEILKFINWSHDSPFFEFTSLATTDKRIIQDDRSTRFPCTTNYKSDNNESSEINLLLCRMQGNNGLLAKTVEKAYFSWFSCLHLISKITRTANKFWPLPSANFAVRVFECLKEQYWQLHFNLIRKNSIKKSYKLRSKKYSNAILLLFVQTMTSLTLTSGSRASSFPGFSLLLREKTLVAAGHVEISVCQ